MKKVLFIGNMNDVMNSTRSWLNVNKFNHDLLEFSNVSSNFRSPLRENGKKYEVKYLFKDNPFYIFLNRKKIINIVNSYDYIIGHNYALALCSISGRNLDLLITHGGDLRNLSKIRYIFNSLGSIKSLLVKPFQLWLTLHQKRGHKSVRYLITNYWDPNVLSSEDLKSTSGKLIQYLTPPYIRRSHIEKIGNSTKVCKSISQYELKVLCHARHEWSTNEIKPSNKGQDKLLKGWSKFIKETNVNGVLILLEYGKDVAQTKELIGELGIEENVMWLPKQKRQDVFDLINSVDLCAAEMNVSVDQNSVHQEILLMGKPLLTYKDEDVMPSIYKILNVRYNDIPTLLKDYLHNSEYYIDIARKNRSEFISRVKETIKFIEYNILN